MDPATHRAFIQSIQSCLKITAKCRSNREFEPFFNRSLSDFVAVPSTIQDSSSFHPQVDFEMITQINNPNPNLSRRYHLGRPELEKGGIGIVNGINCSLEDAHRNALLLSSYAGGVNVHAVYNAHVGVMDDIFKAGLAMVEPCMTLCARQLQETWKDFFAHASPNERYLQIGHSGGTAQIYIALLTFPVELRNRIEIVAIAPSKYISKNLCYKVTHYESADFVPHFDRKGRQECLDTIIILPPHPDVSWIDRSLHLVHSLNDPTYKKPITDRIEEFIVETNIW